MGNAVTEEYIRRSEALDAIRRFSTENGSVLGYHSGAIDLATIQCSLCSEEWCFETDDDVSLLNYKYCPNCGAKMDGGNDDATD